jgi:hypothetical protein
MAHLKNARAEEDADALEKAHEPDGVRAPPRCHMSLPS